MRENWIEKKFGDPDLMQIIDGDRGKNYPQQSDFISEGYCVFLNTKNVRPGGFNFDALMFINKEKDENLRKGKLNRRDVILTTRGTIGNIAIYDDSVEFDHVRINSGMLILRPNEGVIISEFLFKMLLSPIIKLQTARHTSGAAQPQLPIKTLVNFVIPVPPIDEQKRIVAIVDQAFEAIDVAIENTKQNLANARELFESYLNDILTQNDNGWQETALGAEIDLMTGFPFKSIRYTDSAQSIRLLRGDNIIQCALRWDDVKKWPESEIDEFLTYQLKEGDVVLAMDRPWVKAGLKHAMISSDDLPCLLVQRTACLRASKDINNRFLMYLIGSHAFTRHILSNQTGIGVPHISGKQIQGFAFLKPPVSKQKIISDNLDELRLNIQRLESIYRQKLAALTELKQSILQKAFTGELTADQEAP